MIITVPLHDCKILNQSNHLIAYEVEVLLLTRLIQLQFEDSLEQEGEKAKQPKDGNF
jgi:hypothetical protein